MLGILLHCTARQSSYPTKASRSVQIHQVSFRPVDLLVRWEKRIRIIIRAERLHHPIIGGEGLCAIRTADCRCVGEPSKRVIPVVLEEIAVDGREVGSMLVPEKAAAGSFDEAGCNLSLDANGSAADHLVEDKHNNTHVNGVLRLHATQAGRV